MSKTANHFKMDPSKIIGIQFSVLSAEEIRRQSVAEITSRDTYINNKPVIGGLFDPRMGVLEPGLICPTDGMNYMQTPGYFGHINLARPVIYVQYLPTIMKILRCVCVKCSKLKISKEKHKHALELPAKERWQYVFKHASTVKRCGDETHDGCGTKQPKKVYKQDLAGIFAEWELTSKDGNSKSKPIVKFTPEMILKTFKRISDEDVTFMGFSPIWSRPDWFICQALAVPPPAVRPSVKHDAQQRSEDDISHIIVNIIKFNKILQEKIEQNAPENVIEDYTTVLQYYIATMVDNRMPGMLPIKQRSGRPLKSIKERLVGKGGRVRGNLMGKRVDFSARSVITPDANISIRELGVPIAIAKNITFPMTVNVRNKKYLKKLVLNGPDVHPGANVIEKKSGDSISLRYADRSAIILEEGDIVHRHMVDGDPILFNRQPTLHRMSMMCHIAKIMKVGKTFRMNVADTKPYNADFDGDEMNLHGPQDEESQSELLNLAAVPHHIISPANNQSIVGIFQDSLLGCYRFTREDEKFSTRQAMNLLMYHKNLDTDLFKKKGRISNFEILSQIMPPISAKFKNKGFSDGENKKTSNNVIEIVNGKYKRGQMDKGVLGSGSKGLIQAIYNDINSKASSDFIDNLQSVITEYMKLSSYSVGISDLIADPRTNTEISKTVLNKKKEVQKLINQLHLSIFENNTGKSNETEFETQVNSILNKAQDEAGKIGKKSLSSENRFVIMVNAGSKGNNINIAQMISCLGQQNVDGKRIPYGFEDRTLPHFNKYDDSPQARGFVESSFIQGLTPEELYFHAMGGRTGLIDTAVKTSQTGYIQRRLIKGMEDLKVCYDMTVRNNKNKIIQFKYGDDNINPCKTENQKIPIVRMSLEEIYEKFNTTINPTQDSKTGEKIEKMKDIIYTKATKRRLYKQKEELKNRTDEVIGLMIDSVPELIKNVFSGQNDITVHIPVHFERIIYNIQNQLEIKKSYLIDITPLEAYKIIDNGYAKLEMNYSTTPTELFKILYYYYLNPKELLFKKKFNKNAIILLVETVIVNYKKAIIHPGEMVGLVAAQSIGEPTTQMTLNTFHYAGVASKSNVTRGVPRIEEILSLSDNCKNPSVTIFMKEDEETDIERAQELKYNLEYTCLKDVAKCVSICYDPKVNETMIEEDKLLIEQFSQFEDILKSCGLEQKTTQKIQYSKWIIRFEMSEENMLDKNITMDEVNFAIRKTLKKLSHANAECVFSDLNSNNLVFRIRLNDFDGSSTSKKKNMQNSLDEEDYIFRLKGIQQYLLNNVVLRGINKIPKILLRKVCNTVKLKQDKHICENIWVLDTVGTNFKEILTRKEIDANRCYSNDIQEVYRTLGIEAARRCVYEEVVEAFSDTTYINYHHISMLCDRICATKKMVSIFRHGINNDDIGPIAKASFEETPEMFLRAAKHAELELMTGISSNVMCGQEGYFGTNSFRLITDIRKMRELGIGAKEFTKEEEIEINLESKQDVCSVSNIEIAHNNKTNTGEEVIDDDYDLDL